MINEEERLPRELSNPSARRGKWTAEEERYTEKIICMHFSSLPICEYSRLIIFFCANIRFPQLILSMVHWMFKVRAEHIHFFYWYLYFQSIATKLNYPNQTFKFQNSSSTNRGYNTALAALAAAELRPDAHHKEIHGQQLHRQAHLCAADPHA